MLRNSDHDQALKLGPQLNGGDTLIRNTMPLTDDQSQGFTAVRGSFQYFPKRGSWEGDPKVVEKSCCHLEFPPFPKRGSHHESSKVRKKSKSSDPTSHQSQQPPAEKETTLPLQTNNIASSPMISVQVTSMETSSDSEAIKSDNVIMHNADHADSDDLRGGALIIHKRSQQSQSEGKSVAVESPGRTLSSSTDEDENQQFEKIMEQAPAPEGGSPHPLAERDLVCLAHRCRSLQVCPNKHAYMPACMSKMFE